MHLYAITLNLPALSERRLANEVSAVGESFALDTSTAWTARSHSGLIVAAGIHHGQGRCGPRRYLARDATHVTWFDGLPVESADRFRGYDAEALAANWQQLEGCLEGQFNAVRLDLQDERAEVLMDTLGLVQVFAARKDHGWLISNSATLIASAHALRSPDPLGVSSFLGLGWAAGDRILTRGAHVLCGGARHTLSTDGLATCRSFGPETIPKRKGERLDARDLAESLTSLTASAVHGMDRVGCALTAGRDTRVLAALLRATGQDALYFTGGTADQPDVVIAREIAQRLGLDHEVVCHDPNSASRDWTEAAEQFVRQNDGLVSLLQLGEHIDLSVERPPLGVKLGGVGGEIGRCGTGELTAVATNVPLLRSSVRVQRKLLAMKARNEGGLMTPDADAELANYLDRFREQRLDEGWRRHELQEAFYTFERVGRWGASGRRMAGTDDAFLPLCSRRFIDYCFSLSAGERFIEAPHYRLLSELSPTLRDHRFETPLLPQRSWLAPLLATRKLTHALRQRMRAPGASESVDAQMPAPVRPAYPFQHAWFEARLDLVRELFSVQGSELWQFVSKPRIEALLDGSEADRARDQEALLRATTVFWHFHGPKPDGLARS